MDTYYAVLHFMRVICLVSAPEGLKAPSLETGHSRSFAPSICPFDAWSLTKIQASTDETQAQAQYAPLGVLGVTVRCV